MSDQSERSEARRWPWLLVWLGALVLIVCDLAQVAVRVATYPTFMRWPGADGYLAEALIALLGYGVVVALVPRVAPRLPGLRDALRVGTIVGLVAGALEVVDISVESLASLTQRVVASATGAAMLTLFLMFALAGFIGSWRARAFWPGLAAAICCAVVAILIAVTFGFALMSVNLPHLAQTMIGDPDYLRSGWTDPAAFAIANTLDNGFTHLIEAPIIAAILGSLAAGLATLTRRRPAAVSA